MRTTITIDDDLLGSLKQRAAATGSTVSRLIESAVRSMLSPAPEATDSEEFELVTFGKGGKFTRHDIDKTWRLLEMDDLERFGRDSTTTEDD